MRIAIIGAGSAGLSGAKHALAASMKVTVFEQTDQIGGTWVYTENVGTDEFGLDIHTSMYKSLKTNLPKEIMGYPDFPFPDQKLSFITAEEVLQFLNLYADTFNLRKMIKFHHYVVRITPKNENQWEILVKDLPNDKLHTYIFDAVLICNGHYHTPLKPNFEGSDLFRGQQIHSHDYRIPDPFVGKRVLLIGAGPSGRDLTFELSKVAEVIFFSFHWDEVKHDTFPKKVIHKTLVKSLTETGAIFEDGTEEVFDVIIYCTGYRFTFPFLSVDCAIKVEDNYVQPLYKHCININRPTMAFIGLPFYVCATQMFDIQVRFCLKFWSGQKKMPSKKEMLEDTKKEMNERWARGCKKQLAHMMGPDQGVYFKELAQIADIEPIKPVMTKLYNTNIELLLNNLRELRKFIYRIIDDETFVQSKYEDS